MSLLDIEDVRGGGGLARQWVGPEEVRCGRRRGDKGGAVGRSDGVDVRKKLIAGRAIQVSGYGPTRS
jgi:hypothetical protein